MFNKLFVSPESEATQSTISVPAGPKRPIEEDEVDGGSVKRVKLESSAAESTKGYTYMGNNHETFLYGVRWFGVNKLSNTREGQDCF